MINGTELGTNMYAEIRVKKGSKSALIVPKIPTQQTNQK